MSTLSMSADEIRRRYRAGTSISILADLNGCGQSLISTIVGEEERPPKEKKPATSRHRVDDMKMINKGMKVIMLDSEASTCEPQDDLLLAEVCSLREKLKIATEIIKSRDPSFCINQLNSADYNQCCEDLSTPEIIRQNIYYRTADRLPTNEDAGPEGHVIISDNTVVWRQCHIACVSCYNFWAPAPKVEVRG